MDMEEILQEELGIDLGKARTYADYVLGEDNDLSKEEMDECLEEFVKAQRYRSGIDTLLDAINKIPTNELSDLLHEFGDFEGDDHITNICRLDETIKKALEDGFGVEVQLAPNQPYIVVRYTFGTYNKWCEINSLSSEREDIEYKFDLPKMCAIHYDELFKRLVE